MEILVSISNPPSSCVHRGPTVHICAGSWGGKLPSDLDGFIKFAEARYKEKPDPDYFVRCIDVLREIEDRMTCSKVLVRESSFFCLSLFVDLNLSHSPSCLHSLSLGFRIAQ